MQFFILGLIHKKKISPYTTNFSNFFYDLVSVVNFFDSVKSMQI